MTIVCFLRSTKVLILKKCLSIAMEHPCQLVKLGTEALFLSMAKPTLSTTSATTSEVSPKPTTSAEVSSTVTPCQSVAIYGALTVKPRLPGYGIIIQLNHLVHQISLTVC